MILAVALGYFTLGFVSLKLATINDFASPVWSPSGFAVGSLALGGMWLAPGIFLGALLTNLTVDTSIFALASMASGNMLEAMLGAYLINYFLKNNTFKNYSELLGITTVALVSSAVSASIGITILYFKGLVSPQNFAYSWYTWWSGDAVGMMVILPFFVELILSKFKGQDFRLKNVLGSLLVISTVIGMTYLVFVQNFNQAFSWILCPLLILSGLSFGKKFSRIILIILSFYIVYLAKKGYGPFEFGNLNINLIYLQCLLISYSFAVLFVRPLTMGMKAGRTFALSTFIGWATVFVVIFITTANEKHQVVEDLDESIQSSLDNIKRDATQHELLLQTSRAVIQIKRMMYFSDWKEYVDSLNLAQNYPALIGLGYVRDVPKNETETFLKEIELKGAKEFKIKDLNPAYTEQFSNRYIITYIEPLDKNFKAQGLDIGGYKQRRLAAESARSSKNTVSTDVISLIQNKNGEKAFSLLHPVWIKEKFNGWVLAPVMANIFFEKSFSDHANLLNLEVSRNGHKLYKQTQNEISFVNSQYIRKIILPFFGLNHELTFYPTTAFFSRHSHSSAPLALLLTLFMLFIAGFLLEQMTFNQRAEILIKNRTEQLEESKIKLIYSSKMASLGEMASSMAHEINNPITIILGKIKVLSFMLADLNVNNKLINEEMQKIETTTNRISRIVRGLKSFSRVADEDPFDLVPLEVIIDETLDLCSERLKNHGIVLRMDEIPEICLLCRPSQISQVFMNMLNNSSDAVMEQDEKVITWNFRIEEPDRFFILISDTGPGIPPEIAPRIMEPFFTTKGVGKGTGLGLSIAKGIIEDHGGHISLDYSTPYSRFLIELPLKNV